MADIFNGLSRTTLKRNIEHLVSLDQRSLPEKAKQFAAIARMQNFDVLPDVLPPHKISDLIADGAVELHRGISSNSSVPAGLYARELVRGPLYPGTQSAIGQGIYLACPSVEDHKHDAFPRISRVAHEYAKKEPPGVIVQCALKKEAKFLGVDDLKMLFRENRNRAREVGITDFGTFAAAMGFDAYFCDHVYDHTDERVWVVVNRGSLVFQNKGLQIGPPKIH